MIELEWSIGGEALGVQPCDGIICATPSGSTAYNLSNGGPVLVWGLDAMVVTFVAPHSLHARPAGRRPRHGPRGDEPLARHRRPSSWWTATGSASFRAARRRGCTSALRAASSRRCPSGRSSAATATSSAPPDDASRAQPPDHFGRVLGTVPRTRPVRSRDRLVWPALCSVRAFGAMSRGLSPGHGRNGLARRPVRPGHWEQSDRLRTMDACSAGCGSRTSSSSARQSSCSTRA